MPWNWPLAYSRWRLGLYIGLALGLNAVFFAWVPDMNPLPRGTAVGYAWAAFRVAIGPLGEESTYSTHTYAPRDGWCIYYIQGFHGQFLRAVPESEVEASLPVILDVFRRPVAGASTPARAAVYEAFHDWDRTISPERRTVRSLREAIKDAVNRKFEQDYPGLGDYERSQEREFNGRWRVVRRYWLTVTFEALFLNGLLAGMCAAVLGRWRTSRRALAVGSLPVAFFLPYWLGYCQWTFTSGGPCGGVLYPILLSPFADLGRFTTEWDEGIFSVLPPLLNPLSQDPGTMLSVSSMGGVPPMAVGLVGVVLGGAVALWPWFREHFKAFDVP